jgi:IS5 family transposase
LIKLGKLALYAPMLAIMARIVRVSQQRGDTNKVYSLDEPSISCIAKGKVHRKYEFGSKVSVASLSGSHVVVGVTNFVVNPHDSTTLAPTLDQVVHWTGQCDARVLVDRGYRGHGQVGNSTVSMLGKKVQASAYALRGHKTPCRRSSAMEAMTST